MGAFSNFLTLTLLQAKPSVLEPRSQTAAPGDNARSRAQTNYPAGWRRRPVVVLVDDCPASAVALSLAPHRPSASFIPTLLTPLIEQTRVPTALGQRST